MKATHRDTQPLARKLEDWFASRVGQKTTISNLLAPKTGVSSETYLVDATVENGAERPQARWVLRIQATTFQVYQDAAVEKQFRILQQLARTSDIPVPRALWYEADPSVLGSPFFLMERVDGRAPPEDYHSQGVLMEADAATRAAMWRDGVRMLARVHKVDPTPFGFLSRPDLGPPGVDEELARWDAFREWTGLPGVAMLDRGRRWLDDNRPASPPTGLAWGDARLPNLMFRGAACVAVLDWETASLGAGESDLGWWLYFDHAASIGSGTARAHGLGGRTATIALWEQEVGRKAQAIEWHEAFAAWRVGWIMERVVALFTARGVAIPVSSGDGNPAVRRLAELIT